MVSHAIPPRFPQGLGPQNCHVILASDLRIRETPLVKDRATVLIRTMRRNGILCAKRKCSVTGQTDSSQKTVITGQTARGYDGC